MNDFFLVVYDYPWQVDGTDVWLTKPYKLASSLKDAKKDVSLFKKILKRKMILKPNRGV